MALTSTIPVSGSIINTGDTVTVVTDDAGGIVSITHVRTGSGATNELIFTDAGGYQTGFTGSYVEVAGPLATAVFQRDAGWDSSPFRLDVTTASTAYSINYTLAAEGQYPPDMQPFNDPVEGSGAATDLDSVINFSTPDNDVLVPEANPVILRDDDKAIVPFSVVKVDTTVGVPGIRVTTPGSAFVGVAVTDGTTETQVGPLGVSAIAGGGDIFAVAPGATTGADAAADTLVAGGSALGSGDGGDLLLNAGISVSGADGKLKSGQSIYIKDQTIAGAIAATYGQVWVRDSDDHLIYTDDTGSSTDLVAAAGNNLQAIIQSGTPDNDVNIPLADPVIFRDGNNVFTPFSVVKEDRTQPAIQVTVPNIGGQDGWDIGLHVISAGWDQGVLVKAGEILFDASTASVVNKIEVRPNNADAEYGGQLNIGAGDNVHATGTAGGNLRLDAGSGVLANGQIRIGGYNPPSKLEITDSASSTGTVGQVLTADGSGDSTWEDSSSSGASDLDSVINSASADNDVNVPATDPVIFRDGNNSITPFSVVKLEGTADAVIIETAAVSGVGLRVKNAADADAWSILKSDQLYFGTTDSGYASLISEANLAISASTGNNISLDTDGDIQFGVVGMSPPNQIEFVQGITIGETADHPVAPAAGEGQFWVNEDGEPIFTSPSDAVVDPGTDYDLTTATPLTLDEVISTAPIDNGVVIPSGNPVIFSDGAVAGLTPLTLVKSGASTTAPTLALTHEDSGVGITIASAGTGATLSVSSQGATPVDDVNFTLTFGGGSVATVAAGDTYFTGRENAASAGDGGDTYVQGGEATHGTPGDGGDVLIDPGDGANVGSVKIGTVNVPTEVVFAQGFSMSESAGPPLGTTGAGKGQFWINQATTPNKPYFTNENDIDIDLTAGSGVGDVTASSTMGANKLIIGDDGAKGVKEAPLGSLSDAGALTAIATIVTTSDITAGNDLVSTVDVNVGADLNVPSGDIVMGATQTVDGRDVSVDGGVLDGHIATVSGNPHDVEGVEVQATAVTDGYVLTADGAGNSAWEVAGTGDVTSGSTITDHSVVRGDGGTKGVQESGITINDTDDITGIVGLTMTGNLAVTGTVDGRDVATDGAKLDLIEDLADVTDTANVTSAGALMDSEVDANIKSLILPASTTISTFGKSLVGAADDTAAAALVAPGMDHAEIGTIGTDNPHNTSLGNLGPGTLAQLTGGSGGVVADVDQFFTNNSGEISTATAKATPIVGDFLLIEDSAASNAKKSITIGDLPANAADEIETSGTNVTISSTAPTGADEVLITTSATAASWGTVGTDAITDNAVTLAKMASGTDGNLITYDASGDPAYVATGTAGQVLTSNGAGAAPTMQTVDIHSKTLTIEDPVAESLPFFFTSKAITITKLRALIQGGTSIPVTIASGTTYLTVVDTNVNAQTASNTTTGADLTVADSTIAVNSNIWVTLGTPVGTQTIITITMEYTED